VMGGIETGTEAEDLAVEPDRVRGAAREQKGVGKIEAEDRLVGSQTDGVHQQSDRPVVLAGVEREQSKAVESGGVGRVLLQNLAVKRLGLGRFAGLFALHGR